MLADKRLMKGTSWPLRVYITDLNREVTVRVLGDNHIGGVMLKVANEAGLQKDFSNHEIWWPAKNLWLKRTRSTLDQYGVTGDAVLEFTPRHKLLRIQMPDMQILSVYVDYTEKVFKVVRQLTKDLGIRHGEEMSLYHRIDASYLRQNTVISPDVPRTPADHRYNLQTPAGYGTLDRTATVPPHAPGSIPPPMQHQTTLQRLSQSLSGSRQNLQNNGASNNNNNNAIYSESNRAPSATDGRISTTTSTGQPAGFGGAVTVTDRYGAFIGSSPVAATGYESNTVVGAAGERIHPYYPENPYTSPSYVQPNQQPAVIFVNEMTDRAALEASLSDSPHHVTNDARNSILSPKSFVQRARLNTAWLDSSVSLYEQGVRENDTLLLRFKYLTMFDLNPKLDKVRINQLYEQARWQLLTEQIECSGEEANMFAGLQLQIERTHGQNETALYSAEDEIDAALTDLQMTLEGGIMPDTVAYGSSGYHPQQQYGGGGHYSTGGSVYGGSTAGGGAAAGGNYSGLNSDITQVPELHDTMQFLKAKRFTLKAYRPHYCVLRDHSLIVYKDEHSNYADPVVHVNLRGAEVVPDVSQAHGNFTIKLQVPSGGGVSDSSSSVNEYSLRCGNDVQFARWLAACRLTAKGKTMADASYGRDVQEILERLHLQSPGAAPVVSPDAVPAQTGEYLPERHARALGPSSRTRIVEANGNVSRLGHTEAKLAYIRAWQGLRDFAMHYFVVRFSDEPKKEYILAVTPNRLVKLDVQHRHLRTWPYTRMIDWNVNWYKKMVVVSFDDQVLEFFPESADCKVVHEFIGGYIFLQLRSKEGSQHIDEDYFHQLTGGWAWQTIH